MKKATPKKAEEMTKRLNKARNLIIDVINECEEINPTFREWSDEGFASCLGGALVYLNDALGIYHEDGKMKVRGVTVQDIMENSPADKDTEEEP